MTIGNELNRQMLEKHLKISQENGQTIVEGQFGFSDGNLVKASVTVSMKGGKPQAKVATPSPTALDFELVSSNNFEGRWLNRAGKMLGASGKRFDPVAAAQASAAVTALANKPLAFELKDSAAAASDLKAGDIWRYVENDQRTKVKVRDIERRLISFANGRWTGAELNGNYVASATLGLIESPNIKTTSGERNDLMFPLKTGMKWPIKYNWNNLVTGSTGLFDGQAQVLSYEKVTTTAGDFDTFKIEIKGFWNSSSGQSGQSTEVLWYAPAVRNVVQREYNDAFSAVRSVLVGFNVSP
jgi:hypothetical protein